MDQKRDAGQSRRRCRSDRSKARVACGWTLGCDRESKVTRRTGDGLRDHRGVTENWLTRNGLRPSAECERARVSRNAAYDGRFFSGVRTTGVYCRPVCQVGPARARNVEFFPSAAAAEASGYRPCLRCLPETAPFSPACKEQKRLVDFSDLLLSETALRSGFRSGSR
ncbi:MAG: hypothetical protein HC869_15600 [Rhodospirillales bacterium]|nr:hypothetical protein [Rhodospirillales bacterium]